MDPEIQKAIDALRAELGKNAIGQARVDELEKKATTSVESVTKLRAELDAIKLANEELQRTTRTLQEQGRVAALKRDPITEKNEGLEMFGMIMRHELARMNRMEVPAAFRGEIARVEGYRNELLARATLTPGSASGSYVVPTPTEASLIDGIEEVSEFMSLIDFTPGLPAGNSFTFPVRKTRPTPQVGRSTDTGMTASDPAFDVVTITPKEHYVYFPVDNNLFLMSPINLGAMALEILREALVDDMARMVLNGAGGAADLTITGIFATTTAAYVQYLPATKVAFADLAKSDLTAAKKKCLKRGRGPRGRWIMGLDIQGLVEDMDRTGKMPVVREQPDGSLRILNNPVVIEEQAPDLADSAISTGFIAFGDPATMKAGAVGGIQIASSADYLFGKNQTAFRGVVNWHAARKPVATLITIRTPAA